MPTQPEFGKKVRELRRGVGLSQAQLAGPEFSASYISLLESGKRVPGPDVVTMLAERLGVPPQSLQEGGKTDDHAAEEARRIDLAGLLFKARKAEEEGSLDAAVDQLNAILETYGACDHQDVLWEVRWTLARIHKDNGAVDESERLLRELLDDEYTRSVPEQRERVARNLAELCLSHGRLPDALRFAHHAWNLAEPRTGWTNWARAGVVLVTACTWSGFHAWGREVADTLVANISDGMSRPLRNAVYRESALLCLFSGDHEQARDWFERALEQFEPRQDIEAWATGLCSLALAEFESGQGLTGRAAERVAKARPVIELLHDTALQAQLTVIEGLLALDRGAHDRARACAETLVDMTPWPATHEVGMCLLYAARIHRDLGDPATAAAIYRRAGELTDRAGSLYACKLVFRELAALQPVATSPS